jgi:uncharacterized repeat protein (TIGR01451 family)
LQISAITVPAGPFSIGQEFNVTVTLSSAGKAEVVTATVSSLSPVLANAAVVKISPPADLSMLPGESTDFVFTLSANGAGTTAFNVEANGFGIDSVAVPQAVSLSGGTVQIVTPATLAAQAKPLSSTVSVGQQFEVHVTVTNTGQAVANNVNLSNFGSVPAGLFTLVSGPAPVSALQALQQPASARVRRHG